MVHVMVICGWLPRMRSPTLAYVIPIIVDSNEVNYS